MEYLKTHDVKDANTKLKVLVVGGGDGYVVNELVKYSKIGVIDHIELDEEVINVSKKYLPWGDAWKDSRVNLIIGDGAKFVKEQAESGHKYDVVIQDSSDPEWEEEDGTITTLPSSVLYEQSHFNNLYKLFEPKSGVFMMQAETYNIPSNLQSIKKWRELLLDVGFDSVRYGSIAIPTYPTGQIGFFAAHIGTTDSKECKSSDDDVCHDKSVSSLEMNWNHAVTQYSEHANTLQYYHPGVHKASYDLPLWIHRYIYDEDP